MKTSCLKNSRKEHPTESIGVYLAVMSSYFNRLRCTISEEAKLKIILKNLHSFYLERLHEPMPTSLAELRVACRSMEARRDMIRNYVEPTPRRSGVLEKDLAYMNTREELDVIESAARTAPTPELQASSIVCFRCKQAGHRAIGYAVPRKLAIFKCNEEGYTVKNCPKCNKKGNGNRRI